MGWGGGTEIFDQVIGDVLESDASEHEQNKIIVNLYDVLRDKDWDNVDESWYFDHPRIRAIIKLREPDWFEDDEDEHACERSRESSDAQEEADRRFGQPHYGHGSDDVEFDEPVSASALSQFDWAEQMTEFQEELTKLRSSQSFAMNEIDALQKLFDNCQQKYS